MHYLPFGKLGTTNMLYLGVLVEEVKWFFCTNSIYPHCGEFMCCLWLKNFCFQNRHRSSLFQWFPLDVALFQLWSALWQLLVSYSEETCSVSQLSWKGLGSITKIASTATEFELQTDDRNKGTPPFNTLIIIETSIQMTKCIIIMYLIAYYRSINLCMLALVDIVVGGSTKKCAGLATPASPFHLKSNRLKRQKSRHSFDCGARM